MFTLPNRVLYNFLLPLKDLAPFHLQLLKSSGLFLLGIVDVIGELRSCGELIQKFLSAAVHWETLLLNVSPLRIARHATECSPSLRARQTLEITCFN